VDKNVIRDEHRPRRSGVRTYRRGAAMPVSFYFHQLFETCDAYIHTLPLNKTVQKAANLAVQAGHRLYTDLTNSAWR